MEQISELLPAIVSQQDLTKLPTDLPANLQLEEREILAVKYKSIPFGKMEQDEIDLWADALILKINAATGWLPPEKTTLIVFTDLFKKKLVLSYSTCNPDEIEYAFIQYGTTVKDWGKSMNLSLIDEVMIPYLEKRFEVSRIEEQQKSKKMIEKRSDEITDDQLWEQIQAAVQKGNYKVDFVPASLYDWMDKNGNILVTREQKHEYVERATLYRHSKIYAEFESDPSNREVKNTLTEFNRMRESKVFEGKEAERIKELAKQMVVFDMMKQRIA